MANEIELPIRIANLPEGFCNTLSGDDWPQALLNAFAQNAAAIFTGAGTVILNQESLPSPEQRAFLWFRPSTGRIFSWDSGGGAWTSPNPSPAGGIDRRWVEGTPEQIWAYDGGDGSDPTSTAPAANVGAMWEIDVNYAGRSPMGVGTIPTSFPSKVLTLAENFGEGAHTQTETEMFRHTHGPKEGFGSFLGLVSAGQPSTKEITSGTEVEAMTTTGETGGHEDAVNDPANICHPIRACYCIRRTARTNYVAS